MTSTMTVTISPRLDTANTTSPAYTESALLTVQHQSAVDETIAVISVLFAFTGVITNACIVWTFNKLGLGEGINFCYVGLAIADFWTNIATGIHQLGYYLHSLDGRLDHLWFEHVDPDLLVFFMGSIGDMLFDISILIIAYIAIAKSLCVILPFRFKQIITLRMFLIHAAVFCTASVAFNLPILVLMGAQYETNERTNAKRWTIWQHPDRKQTKTIVRIFTIFLLSLTTEIIIVMSVFIMLMQVRRSMHLRSTIRRQESTKLRNSNSNLFSLKLTKKEMSIVQQVLVISLIFLICNIPRMLQSIWILVDPEYDYGHKLEDRYEVMNNTKTFFMIINCSSNIFVYLIFDSRFRGYWCQRFGRIPNTTSDCVTSHGKQHPNDSTVNSDPGLPVDTHLAQDAVSSASTHSKDA